MRFASYLNKLGRDCYGAVTDDGLVCLSSNFPQWATLQDVVASGGVGKLEEAVASHPVTDLPDEVTYQIPLHAPGKIICVGVNFPDRGAEYKGGEGRADAQNMSLFVRFPNSFTGHRQPLVRPRASEQLDYEGEIAVIIGKGGRHIAAADAYGHIAALTLCNEGTLRDWTRHARFNVTQGKNFDKSGSMGPWLVPFVSDNQLDNVRLTTKVNGELRQDDLTGNMIYPIRRQVEYISTFTTLAPGDIIVTGTPSGAGARQDPPVYLRPGDTVEVSAAGIGSLVNTVEDEQ